MIWGITRLSKIIAQVPLLVGQDDRLIWGTTSSANNDSKERFAWAVSADMAGRPDPWRADRPDAFCHGCDRSRRGWRSVLVGCWRACSPSIKSWASTRTWLFKPS